MVRRPLVIPETYSGEDGWYEWIVQFENIASVNSWSTEEKLKWIKVLLAGRAQKAFQGLPEATRGSYGDAKTALTERFEPASKRELYNAELQVQAKKYSEGWANFAEELRHLVDKAFPDLEANAREQLALNHYLSRLHNPQVGFAVKQQRPKKLEDFEAACITLEVESYLIKPTTVGQVEVESQLTAGAVGQDYQSVPTGKQVAENTLVKAIDQLTQRLERLEETTRRVDTNKSRKFSGQTRGQSSNQRAGVICYRCGKEGHYARGCASSRSQGQGN